ncbi:hypothetical protein ATANTOWER_002607 [Ataeniobius toweri]|uniref:Groucho/TLE N-terminal Q-rich domain-containing protein n=1 Tax=Ataeniobius toweri TaxID=208326 RepID=A0ABU7BN57_9TELE|nr:hypothetical protein [Ataeniobius toweri]
MRKTEAPLQAPPGSSASVVAAAAAAAAAAASGTPQSLKLTYPETLDRIKEEFQFLQTQYHRDKLRAETCPSKQLTGGYYSQVDRLINVSLHRQFTQHLCFRLRETQGTRRNPHTFWRIKGLQCVSPQKKSTWRKPTPAQGERASSIQKSTCWDFNSMTVWMGGSDNNCTTMQPKKEYFIF